MRSKNAVLAVALLVAGAPGLRAQELPHQELERSVPAPAGTSGEATATLPDPAAAIVAAQGETRLRLLLQEVLDRNPSVAALVAEARAAEQRAPQVDALPDPVVSVTAFLSSPETRVGPQYGTVALSQRFPWFGKLPAREQVELAAAVAARNAIAVPANAVLRTGERNVVIVALGGGRFAPRDVTLGPGGDGFVQVLEGLSDGDEVVTSSQFLIDSESNLREAIQKMIAARKADRDHPEALRDEGANGQPGKANGGGR